MTRFAVAWLVIFSLGACGPSFSASESAAGGGGGSGAPQGGEGNPAGAAGRAQGGASGIAGSGANTGSSGGPMAGSGGSAGSGGVIDVPAIPSNGLSLWLRADVGVMEKSGGVQIWTDQSGQQMDATSLAANAAPKLVKDGLNGMPTLDFDGSDDFLNLPEGFADFSQGLSVFTIARATDGNCASIWEVSNGTEIQDISLGLYQSTWEYEVEDEDLNGGTIEQTREAPALIAAVQHTNGTVELRKNSNLLDQKQFNAPEVVLRKQNFVGLTRYANCNSFKGQLSELIVYDRAVTDKEVIAIEGYLETRYHISISLP